MNTQNVFFQQFLCAISNVPKYSFKWILNPKLSYSIKNKYK